MAGEHAQEDGEGVEEEPRRAGIPQPVAQGEQLQRTPRQLHQQGEQGGSQHRPQHHHQPRQVVAEEQPLPAHRQGPHKVGRPGGIEVAARRHGRQQPHQHRHHQCESGAGQIRYTPSKPGQPPLHPSPILPQGHEPPDGEHEQQHHQPGRPDGPEPGQMLAEDGQIKVRCPGPHSPHLPSRRRRSPPGSGAAPPGTGGHRRQTDPSPRRRSPEGYRCTPAPG